MSRPQVQHKAPADRLDYVVNFDRWLEVGDRVTDATSAIEGGTATIAETLHDDTAIRVWIEGGADGELNHVTVTATTLQGRTKEACFSLRVRFC